MARDGEPLATEEAGLELDWDASPALAARRMAMQPGAPEEEQVVPLSEAELALDGTEPPAPGSVMPPGGLASTRTEPLPSAPVAVARELPSAGADVEEAPREPAWGLFALGVLTLVGTGGALLIQEALPERFPSLLEMVVLRPALTGVPSDFFPTSAWGLALLSWGLLALALGVGHRLALRAGSPLEIGGLESVALVLVPGLGLVGGPYVLRALGKAAESRKAGSRLRLGERALLAVLLYAGAVALTIAEARSPGALVHAAALVARLLSGAAFAAVLAGVGRAFGVLARCGGRPVGRTRGEGSGPALVWAGMLAATGVALAGVWFFRSEWRACEPGTALRHTSGPGGERVSACVLPSGRRQGPEWVRGSDGRLLASGKYHAGQRHGSFRTLSEKGVLLEERTYAEGRPHGTWTLYQPSGERLLAEGYADGLLEGPSTLYHPNGNPRFLKNYQKGVAHGPHSTWFESGLVEVEGAFEQGKPSGWWAQRDQEGKVARQWSAGVTASEDTAGVLALGVSNGGTLRAGHTPRWWKERLELLRNKAARDPTFVALYELTLRRARANGFTVFEKPEGMVVALQPVP
ncbi:hypothetical protein [Archangium sp.]|uniref:hypothetical protein n=1 Tax=Archangium sp. TaxID=1872627 RepID=UPI002ED9C54C